MCNCKSYNRPDLGGDVEEVVLQAPEWSHRDHICIDACIVPVIQHLWDKGIETHSSCCGHNGAFGRPSIVIQNSISEQEAREVRRLVGEVDDRPFDLLSWCLVEVPPCD